MSSSKPYVVGNQVRLKARKTAYSAVDKGYIRMTAVRSSTFSITNGFPGSNPLQYLALDRIHKGEVKQVDQVTDMAYRISHVP
jgi:hypothetical protein